MQKLTLLFSLLALLWTVGLGLGQEATVSVLADFEVDELFEGRDPYNNAIGHAPWGDIAGNVQLSLAEMERVDVRSTVLAINYDIGAWGGFTQAFTDGENWISQDWTAYNGLRFWLYGNNTGGAVQVEIFDNRNPNLAGDSAERWYYRIADDYDGWREFTIEFRSFQRRSDWQPGGAPDDGLGLDKVSGLAFGFPAGAGAQTAYLDDVQLVRLEVQPLMLDDFEMDELFVGKDGDGNDIGYVTWGDAPDNVELSLFRAKRGGQESGALNMNFDIAAWGGFTHVLNDGENWIGMNWRDYNAISFAFLGNNSGGTIQFEIFDNRNLDLAGDSAERWFYRFDDDAYGWRLIEIPFIDFQRRSDWQPSGAPDDGLGLDAVSGYAFGLPAGIGSAFVIIDEVQLVVLQGVASPAAAVVEEVAAGGSARDSRAAGRPAQRSAAGAASLRRACSGRGLRIRLAIHKPDGRTSHRLRRLGRYDCQRDHRRQPDHAFHRVGGPRSQRAQSDLARRLQHRRLGRLSPMPSATALVGKVWTGRGTTLCNSGFTAITRGASSKSRSSITARWTATLIRLSASFITCWMTTRAGSSSPFPSPSSSAAPIGSLAARLMMASIWTPSGGTPLASRRASAPQTALSR